MTSDNFIPHKNVPGPKREPTEKADNSGRVNTDTQFVADRQAIVNTITAYSFLIDEGRWEDWFALFSDDIEFVNTTPDLGTVVSRGKKAFRQIAEDRYIIPGKTSIAVRRHTMGNVHVVEQTATTAKVRTYMLISNVPAADKLQLLTTGTYNANLEKRGGRWVITRWYIEADAPLAPSKLPEGFSKSEFKWIPDPSTKLKDAVDGPVKGTVSLKNHPSTMPASSPLYSAVSVNKWTDSDFVLVDYVTDAKSAAAFLPEQVTTFSIPELPGYAPVKQVWAHYRDSTFGPYDELIVSIPCLYKGQMYLYVPLIYVTTDRALCSGREVGGWPKKLGAIKIEQFGSEFRVAFSRGGGQLASLSTKVGRKLFSTPLPANAPVTLPFPYHMTLPLPAPTGKPQESFPFPTMTLRLFPGVGSDRPQPALAELIGAEWRMAGEVYGCSDSTAEYYPSDDDPFYKLPIIRLLGSAYIRGDMTLALRDIKVLENLLDGKGNRR